MSKSEYLELDDPVLALVRQHAPTNPASHRWLLESGRHWARREFVRRARERDYEECGAGRVERLDDDLRRLARHQVAILTRGVVGVGPQQREHTGIICGFLAEGCNADYIVVFGPGGTRVAGMIHAEDVIELHPGYRVPAWPWPVE